MPLHTQPHYHGVFLFLNNFRCTESCQNNTGRSCHPSPSFPNVNISYHNDHIGPVLLPELQTLF